MMRKKTKDPIAAREKAIEEIRKTLVDYSLNSIERCLKSSQKQMDEMMITYPYEAYVKYVDCICNRYRANRSNSFLWDECHSNAYIAYWYSIGRCTVLGISGDHAENYIRKVIRGHIKGMVALYALENGHVSWNEIVERKYKADLAD